MTAPLLDAQPLIDAIEAAIGAAGVPFGDAEKPASATTRYAIGWFDAGTVGDRSLMSRDALTLTATFHFVGTGPDGARWVARKVRAAILDMHRAEVSSRTVQMPVNLTSVPMSRDDDADPTLWRLIDEWRFRLA